MKASEIAKYGESAGRENCEFLSSSRNIVNVSVRHAARFTEHAETTMLRLNPRQRNLLIEKVPDVANLGAGSMVFGQILSGQAFSIGWAVFGIAFWFVLFGLMLFVASGE